jgi:hypothetical protein
MMKTSPDISCSILRVNFSQMKHSEKFMLPTGRILTLIPGNIIFKTKDFVFKLYSVRGFTFEKKT